MVTLRTVLALPELKLTVRTGADQLDRGISRIYGTELPDPGRFLSGGELVISGLLWLKSEADIPPFVDALAAAPVAALICSDADTGVIPDALVEECARRSVPLLETSPNLSFAVITERVGLELAHEKVGESMAARTRHRRLLAAVTRRMGMPELLRLGAEQLDAPCWVLTPTGRVVAGSGPELPEVVRPQLVRDFLLADRLPRLVRNRIGGPYSLLAVDEPAGPDLGRWCMVVGEGRDLTTPPYDEVAAELASLVGLQRSREQDSRRIENRPVGPMLRSVLAGTSGPTELVAAAVAAGLDANQPVRVIAAAAPEWGPAVAGALLEELTMAVDPAALVGLVGEEAYALLRVDPNAPGDVPARLTAGLNAVEPALRDGRLVLGVSSPTAVAELRGAVQEARQARIVGERRPGRTSVVAGEEIAVHQLLLATAPEELRQAVRRRLLGPVLDYDAEHNSGLLDTLRVFLECSGSWTRAAARLHVHVNTLRYRIGRIEELIGSSLDSFPDRVDVYLALHASE